MELLELWMSGILLWHRKTLRYPESSLRNSANPGGVIHGLTGPGTAAARLFQLGGGPFRSEATESKPTFVPPGPPVMPWSRQTKGGGAGEQSVGAQKEDRGKEDRKAPRGADPEETCRTKENDPASKPGFVPPGPPVMPWSKKREDAGQANAAGRKADD